MQAEVGIDPKISAVRATRRLKKRRSFAPFSGHPAETVRHTRLNFRHKKAPAKRSGGITEAYSLEARNLIMQKILYLCKRQQAIFRIRLRMLAFALRYAVAGGSPAYENYQALKKQLALYRLDLGTSRLDKRWESTP
jgi:hypothetical protein